MSGMQTGSADPANAARGISMPEGLLVATIPLAGYLLAFAYEAGFCGVFHIPMSFMTLSPTMVFAAIAGLALLVAPLLWFANLMCMLGLGLGDPIARSLIRLAIPAALFLLSIGINLKAWRESMGLLLLLAFFVLLEFGLPLLTQRDKETYREKLLGQEAIEARVTDLFDVLGRRFGTLRVTIAMVMIMAILVSNIAGRGQAKGQEEFLVLPSSPEVVVLRVYGDDLVCAQFDRITQEVQPHFFVIKRVTLPSEPRMQLNLEKVGPLRLSQAR